MTDTIRSKNGVILARTVGSVLATSCGGETYDAWIDIYRESRNCRYGPPLVMGSMYQRLYATWLYSQPLTPCSGYNVDMSAMMLLLDMSIRNRSSGVEQPRTFTYDVKLKTKTDCVLGIMYPYANSGLPSVLFGLDDSITIWVNGNEVYRRWAYQNPDVEVKTCNISHSFVDPNPGTYSAPTLMMNLSANTPVRFQIMLCDDAYQYANGGPILCLWKPLGMDPSNWPSVYNPNNFVLFANNTPSQGISSMSSPLVISSDADEVCDTCPVSGSCPNRHCCGNQPVQGGCQLGKW